ncbi:hypothetical protein TNCT_65021 [Trichonephila clavata]|uniref:Uncharacterized protein n=1 Tax=Trichonephila clavata TaxID=2740835 RepID=A0A8X6LU59_TRICU|nr:hypothetical protein TNCT_65021 [Trichonephila clavata]
MLNILSPQPRLLNIEDGVGHSKLNWFCGASFRFNLQGDSFVDVCDGETTMQCVSGWKKGTVVVYVYPTCFLYAKKEFPFLFLPIIAMFFYTFRLCRRLVNRILTKQEALCGREARELF